MATSDSKWLSNVILAESRFDLGAQGWRREGDGTLTHSRTDGNPGGCLKVVDAVANNVFYFLAPSEFLGDKQSAVRLDYDIKWVENRDLPIFPADREVELVGGQTRTTRTMLIYHTGPPPRNTWFHCSVPLHATTGWTNKTENRPATDEDFKVVLNSLERLAIRGEFARGGPEITYLDNVVMYQEIVPVREVAE